MMEKIPHTTGNYVSPFEMWFRLVTVQAQNYQLFLVSVSVLDVNQNSGFGGTLFCVKMVQRYARKKLGKWAKLNFGEIKAAKKMTQQIYSEFK